MIKELHKQYDRNNKNNIVKEFIIDEENRNRIKKNKSLFLKNNYESSSLYELSSNNFSLIIQILSEKLKMLIENNDKRGVFNKYLNPFSISLEDKLKKVIENIKNNNKNIDYLFTQINENFFIE